VSEERDRRFGFRWMWWDPLMLLLGVGLPLVLQGPLGEAAWLLAVPVAAFFLFCNVFRVGTRLELIWAAVFVATAAAAQVAGLTGGALVAGVLGIVLPFTALILSTAMRSPDYHGVLARRLNRDFEGWLARCSRVSPRDPAG